MDEAFEDELYVDMLEQEREEAQRFALIQRMAHYCPVCGVFCGEPDFEPDDPSVGIFGWLFANWCDNCQQDFYTYDDGTQGTD